MEIERVVGASQRMQPEKACPGNFSMEIYGSFEACADQASRWDAFVESVSGDIFLTYDWCRVWWKYYGTDRHLRLYVFRLESRWVGLMPMFLETVRLGPFSLRRSKIVGSDFTAGQFRPAIEKEYLGPVLQYLVDDLERVGFDQVLLGPVAGRYRLYPELLDGLRQVCRGRYDLAVNDNQVQIYYGLAETYDQWLESLKPTHRKSIVGDFRRLEKQSLTFVFEAASEETWEVMFEDFVGLHQAYWNGRGKRGHFAGGSRSLAFHREMARAQLTQKRLRLFRLQCADGSRAYKYSFLCGDTYFQYISARTLSSPPKVSISRLLHAQTVKEALTESVAWIDSMQGMYEHKILLGGKPFPLRTVLLNRKDLRGRIRIRLFSWAARLLHLLYYRIYYFRLAARLYGHRRKEPWSLWRRACC